jgi:flavin-binding protein dodecin
MDGRAQRLRFAKSHRENSKEPNPPRSSIIKERRVIAMAKIVKVIEVMSESPKSWEEAAQNIVSEASKTLRNIRSVYIKEFTAAVENDKVTGYRVNAKVTFEMER